MKRSGPFAGCSLEGGGLVLDGQTVKLRLQSLAGANGPVHVDWLRFSVPRSSILELVPYIESDDSLFAYDVPVWDEQTRMQRLRKQIDHVTLDCSALAAARVLGRQVVEALGEDFTCDDQPALGRDFFAFRLPIRRAGYEVGWIGGGASSTKPNQQQQAAVVHVNLYGEACLWVSPYAMSQVARLGERLNGWITRCDLAVDFWSGIDGGMAGLEQAYWAGEMDVRGKTPKIGHAGDWFNKRACTLYLGSREAGKYTRIYLKGDQLFGVEAEDKWTRIELQWGDQLRVLPWAMLDKPAEFFAGASDWHASMLAQASQQVFEARAVPCDPAAAPMTVEAEAYRNLNWLFRTAGASVAAAFKHLTETEFVQLVDRADVPGRLGRFKHDEVARGYSAACRRFFDGLWGQPVPSIDLNPGHLEIAACA